MDPTVQLSAVELDRNTKYPLPKERGYFFICFYENKKENEYV